jgi:transcriptional regulator with XRE-family HTH domain
MNYGIKQIIRESRCRQYEIAAKMGISEYTLCKWFRKELTAEQQERILAAIADIKAGEAHV